MKHISAQRADLVHRLIGRCRGIQLPLHAAQSIGQPGVVALQPLHPRREVGLMTDDVGMEGIRTFVDTDVTVEGSPQFLDPVADTL